MVIGILGFTLSLTLIYHGMRGIMRLGGFVATGGPYHIAHHAPNWFWIFPVSFFGGFIFMVFNQVNAKRIGGINLLIWLFPALFITLGYNFFEFALSPPNQQQGIVWGWLVCGILFALMGVLPFILILRNIYIMLRQKIHSDETHMPESIPRDGSETAGYISEKLVLFTVVILNMASIAGGIYLGITIFKAVSS